MCHWPQRKVGLGLHEHKGINIAKEESFEHSPLLFCLCFQRINICVMHVLAKLVAGSLLYKYFCEDRFKLWSIKGVIILFCQVSLTITSVLLTSTHTYRTDLCSVPCHIVPWTVATICSGQTAPSSKPPSDSYRKMKYMIVHTLVFRLFRMVINFKCTVC